MQNNIIFQETNSLILLQVEWWNEISFDKNIETKKIPPARIIVNTIFFFLSLIRLKGFQQKLRPNVIIALTEKQQCTTTSHLNWVKQSFTHTTQRKQFLIYFTQLYGKKYKRLSVAMCDLVRLK